MKKVIILLTGLVLAAGCKSGGEREGAVKPLYVTEPARHDTDDPAIWVNPEDPSKSLIIGTDKNEDGALYVYDLEGKIIKVVDGLKRPNNVDVEYGLMLNGRPVDIAVTTERLTHKLRIYRLPDMEPIDNGGLEVYQGETGEEFRDLMGVALYKRPSDQAIFVIAGRKSGPAEDYLWQYRLEDDGTGNVKASLARKFGKYSLTKEIEAIAVDDALGYVYYSDEGVGVRKYYADPEKGNEELALFATTGIKEDHEGISIYHLSDSTGYILLSDQQADQFHVFPREGMKGAPHQHDLITIIKTSTHESDGSEICSVPLNSNFQKGLFVAMSDNKTFQLYRWEDLAGETLKTFADK
ncbi:MAG: phytase [Leadbetterella sp.]|nr:phytase [Leadbetterella sp.]